jgi:hypothetical protein
MRVKPPFAAVLAAVLPVALSVAPPGAAAEEACAISGEAEPVRLKGLGRHGDILLEDGRVVRLAGLAPRQSDAEREHYAARLSRWFGEDVLFDPVGGADRWGRIPARLLAFVETAPGGTVDLSAVLLAQGAALHLPEPGLPACNALWRQARPRLAAARAQAVPAGAAPLVDGHDPAAMRAEVGRFAVVEGRIATVAERTGRTYLNFERRRGAGGSIVIGRTLWGELQRMGWTASALAGKRMRVRGVIEGRDGLLVEATSRAALEMIE